MSKFKSLAIAMMEELQDLHVQLYNLDMELAFLEHEEYSLSTRIAAKRIEIDDKQLEIENQKKETMDGLK